VRKPSLFLFLCLSVFSLSAFAEEWSKSYQVGDKPSLRVDTNDASVEISRGVSRTVSARIISEGYSIGGSGVRVTEHQDANKVDLQVHVPNSWGLHMSRHEGVRIEIQVPPETVLDLHSGDGHIRVDGTTGPAKLDTGDGHIEVRNFNGALNAHTGDGHMTIDAVLTDLNLRTGDGHIDLTVRPGSKMNTGWLIHTSDGRVEARLPEDFAAELYAHTGDGHIQLDLPVTVNGSIERSRIRGKLNGGGLLLEITTGDGSIRIGKF
jgi:Putative adhesin